MPTAQHHTKHSQSSPQPTALPKSQFKRKHRSQDARRQRQQHRIQRWASARRAYRGWIQQLPSPRPICGKGSTNEVHHPKPSHSAALQTHPQGGGPLYNSLTSKKRSFISRVNFRRRLQFLKFKTQVSQNNKTPSHLRQRPHHTPSSQTTPTAPPSTQPRNSPEEAHRHKQRQGNGGGSRMQWQQQHDLKQRQHTRARWFKTHIQQPITHGRLKHDMQVASHVGLVGGFWNTTGLLEAGKMRSAAQLMRQRKLYWLALTETPAKQQDQYLIDGYTFSHGAHEEFDEDGKLKQTFTGVSLVTAPHITPAVIEMTIHSGRLMSFTLDMVEAPLTVYAVYAPHNHREQKLRDDSGRSSQSKYTAAKGHLSLSVMSMCNYWMSYPQLKGQLVHNSSGRRLWKMSHKKQRQQETPPMSSSLS